MPCTVARQHGATNHPNPGGLWVFFPSAVGRQHYMAGPIADIVFGLCALCGFWRFVQKQRLGLVGLLDSIGHLNALQKLDMPAYLVVVAS